MMKNVERELGAVSKCKRKYELQELTGSGYRGIHQNLYWNKLVAAPFLKFQ